MPCLRISKLRFGVNTLLLAAGEGKIVPSPLAILATLPKESNSRISLICLSKMSFVSKRRNFNTDKADWDEIVHPGGQGSCRDPRLMPRPVITSPPVFIAYCATERLPFGEAPIRILFGSGRAAVKKPCSNSCVLSVRNSSNESG